MLKKRLIGVITFLDGWAVQSFGYKKYLPLGKPEVIARNLDNWGADEILIQSIDRSINNYGPDFELLNSLRDLALSTPLSYGGGIYTLDHAVEVIPILLRQYFQNCPTAKLSCETTTKYSSNWQ